MTATCRRWLRRLSPLCLAAGFLLFPAITHSVHAQGPAPDVAKMQQDEEAAAAGGDKGRPLDGYLGTITLVLLALFIVGKSARR
jgi:hypothetical protein